MTIENAGCVRTPNPWNLNRVLPTTCILDVRIKRSVDVFVGCATIGYENRTTGLLALRISNDSDGRRTIGRRSRDCLPWPPVCLARGGGGIVRIRVINLVVGARVEDGGPICANRDDGGAVVGLGPVDRERLTAINRNPDLVVDPALRSDIGSRGAERISESFACRIRSFDPVGTIRRTETNQLPHPTAFTGRTSGCIRG